MSRYDPNRIERVTVTVPARILTAADQVAQAEHRSRSWVFAEAVARYTSRAPSKAPDSSFFEAARVDRLKSDLALTPEERVREVENLASIAVAQHHSPPAHWIIAFERWEDYLAWKRADRLP